MSSPVSAAEVIAGVDRNELVEGETFEILDQRSETQMSIVNGRQVAVVRLMLTLEPKRTGIIMIPALSLPGTTTQPIRVSVEPAPELEPGEMPPVFIELSMEPEQGPYYVHAQLSLTVRIFYQQNLTEAAINPPAPSQASVRLLDEVPFQSTRNGIRYRVLERKYAIFPERSGELEIPPLTLSGRLIERPADRLWQPSVRGRRVSVESDPIKVSVLPKPAEYLGDHWLPARRITLSQQISDATGLEVGEPVTRTVILDAVGLEENMIEEPVWPEMEDARIYPDQPQGISRDNGQWVLGHKEFRYAVVPEQAGVMVLPEIRLDWWDTTSNQLKTAILPEHRIDVAPSQLATGLTTQETGAVSPAFLPGPADASLSADVKFWRVLAMVFASFWVITTVLLFRGGSRKSRKRENNDEPDSDEASLLAGLKKACMSNDAVRVRNLFGRWLRHYGPEQARGSMMEFARTIEGQELHSAIRVFDAGEFSPQEQSDWNGSAFWKAFTDWKQSGRKQGTDPEADPDLYARA
jgi:hypothetical protein